MIFAFENGKVSKVEMSAYSTKVNRKKLINAYSDKYRLISIYYIKNDRDFVAVRDNDKAMLFNSSEILPKTTKNTQGVQVYTLKKNSVLSKFVLSEEFKSKDIEYYRVIKIPSTGHFIVDDDLTNNL